MRRMRISQLLATPTLFAWGWLASGDRLVATSPDQAQPDEARLGEESRSSGLPVEANGSIFFDGESVVADDCSESSREEFRTNEQQPAQPSVWADTPQEIAAEAIRLRDARGSIVPDDFGNTARPKDHRERVSNGLHDRGFWSPERPRSQVRWGQAPSSEQRDRRMPSAIAVLREAAIGLDAAANRLEGFELYDEADSLRTEAQKMRVKARTLSGSSAGAMDVQAPSLLPESHSPR